MEDTTNHRLPNHSNIEIHIRAIYWEPHGTPILTTKIYQLQLHTMPQ